MIRILLANEIYKLVKKKKIFIFAILTAVICVIQVLLSYKYDNSKDIDWKASAEAQIQYADEIVMDESIDKNSDDYKEVQKQKQYAEYMLSNNIPSVYIRTYWAAVTDSLSMMIFASIFSILICCEIFCEDYSLKTLKMMFTRPSKRSDIWFAKILTAVICFIIFSLIIISTSCLINIFLYDVNQANQSILYLNDEGVVVQKSYVIYMLQTYLCSVFEGLGYILLTALCAVLFKNASITMTVSLVMLFGSNIVISMYEQKWEWIKYILFYNNDLSQYLNNGVTFWKTTMIYSLVLSLVYYIIFYIVGSAVYSKQEIY